jgi:hypothetical protein
LVDVRDGVGVLVGVMGLSFDDFGLFYCMRWLS